MGDRETVGMVVSGGGMGLVLANILGGLIPDLRTALVYVLPLMSRRAVPGAGLFGIEGSVGAVAAVGEKLRLPGTDCIAATDPCSIPRAGPEAQC